MIINLTGAEAREYLTKTAEQAEIFGWDNVFGNPQDDEDEKEKERKRKNEEALNAGDGRGFGRGFMDGFGAGLGSTFDFFKSLGTTEGWQAFGQGMLDFAMLGCQTCPEGMLMRVQMSNRTVNYVQNIPNMSAYEIGYDLGFGAEKGLEIAITRRVIPLPKSLLGVRNVGHASRFSTIQSVSTYKNWGTFSKRRFTWPNGGYTLDKATFYNRNFIIPAGRTIGIGQLQYLQNK